MKQWLDKVSQLAEHVILGKFMKSQCMERFPFYGQEELKRTINPTQSRTEMRQDELLYDMAPNPTSTLTVDTKFWILSCRT